MSDLHDEIRGHFERFTSENKTKDGMIHFVPGDPSMPPGFEAMLTFFKEQILIVNRRGYRHFAGSTMDPDPDSLVEKTSEQMMSGFLASVMEAFCCGLKVGHHDDYLVKMRLHYNEPELLFKDKEFLDAATIMAEGIAGDEQVVDLFGRFFVTVMGQISTITGFGDDLDQTTAKIWDLWMFTGVSCVCVAYLVGHRMGVSWHERDVLDSITIATEEDASWT